MARHGDGLYLRGKDTWYLNCQINGKRYQVKLGKHVSKSVAKELALVKRAQILKGEAGIGNKRKDCSFMKAKEEFLKHTKTDRRPRTYQTYHECLTRIATSFHGKRLSEINTWLIKGHHQNRVASGARIRANREVAVLKNLFNFAIRMGFYEGDNPASGIKLPKEPWQKVRYLEPEEESRLIQQLKEPLRTLVIVGIHCGIRVQSEGLSLKWNHIDLKRDLLCVEAAFAKNGEQRVIPLNATVREALKNLKEGETCEYVFAKDGIPHRQIGKSFKRACQRANLDGVSPHVLRHTFASRLVMNGVDLRTVQDLGGWKNIGMVVRYAHLSPDHRKRAVERLVIKNSPTLLTTSLNEGRADCA
jgi:integrase